MAQRLELGAVDADLGEAGARVGLRETDRADVRMREHRRRDVQVVDPPLGAAEQVVDQRHRLGERNRRQLDAIDDVADRIDPRHAGAVALVDDDRAVDVERDADRLEAEAGDVGRAAGGIEHGVGVEDAAIVQGDPDRRGRRDRC